jgi:NAD+ synthase (glutamine-hydrolysing)
MREENQLLSIIVIKNHKKVTNKNLKIKVDSENKNKSKFTRNSNFKLTYDRYKELISCQEEEILKALILGTRDYILKNGFKKVVLGLSGGIDSALTAVIASFAIGNQNITGIIMPSIYSSKESIGDSITLSSKIGINTLIIPISNVYASYLDNLKDIFKTNEINITKENLQARIRGNILMGLSNENGWLVLATGNKSEISVGYCTLYGDMAGGFSPIKDIYKTMVYDICNFINKKYSNIIPDTIMGKAPSAELKPNQTDQDKLPPYNLLDSILKAYIEEEKDYHDIVQLGFEEKMVKNVINMVDFNEYKRRQGSPGIKITQRAFGRDRRYPITNKFKLR